MASDIAGLRRLDCIIWAFTALTAAVVLAAVIFGDFTIALKTFITPAGTCLLLMLVAFYYRDWRDDYDLASSLECTAQLITFAAVGAPLSYIAASLSLPLHDATFDHWDRGLGFDWKELLAFMNRQPTFFMFMHLIYLSPIVQMVAAVLLLGFTGRLAWLRVYVLAFVFAALITIAVSAFLPAEGAWLYYGISGASEALPLSHTSWPVFFGLREGDFRLLTGVHAEGIITFPSLHAALAVILAAAFWPVPIARWIAATIDALMLVATPIDGSHYLTDVLAGIGIAVLCLAIARSTVMRLGYSPAGIPSKCPVPAFG